MAGKWPEIARITPHALHSMRKGLSFQAYTLRASKNNKQRKYTDFTREKKDKKTLFFYKKLVKIGRNRPFFRPPAKFEWPESGRKCSKLSPTHFIRCGLHFSFKRTLWERVKTKRKKIEQFEKKGTKCTLCAFSGEIWGGPLMPFWFWKLALAAPTTFVHLWHNRKVTLWICHFERSLLQAGSKGYEKLKIGWSLLSSENLWKTRTFQLSMRCQVLTQESFGCFNGSIFACMQRAQNNTLKLSPKSTFFRPKCCRP